MIRSRCSCAGPPAVTIRPPFETGAKAATARSISPASRFLSGCTSTLSDGATERERGQFRRVSANVGGIGCGPAGVDPHVASDDPARLRQRLQEGAEPGL